MSAVLRRAGASSVDLVALAAVALHPFSLYVVLLLYWGDLFAGTIRQTCQTVFSAPRETYSPTEPPAIDRNGDPNPLRFLQAKLGTVQPVDWLPPVAVHNLKPALVGVLSVSLTALAVALTTTVLDPPFVVSSWPTLAFFAAGGLAIVATHAWAFRRFVRSERPPVTTGFPNRRWLGTIALALPVVAVDAVHAGATFDPSTGFAAVALVLVVGRVAYATRRDPPPTGADPFALPAPTTPPNERFRTDRRAVRVAGAIDGLVPRLEWDVRNVSARLVALFVVAAGAFVAAYVAGPTALVGAGIGVAFVVVATAFALAGVVHFELAFGAMEYQLHDDELVAYDTRLDAVQWRAPLDAIEHVSVDSGFWTSPPGSDAATVTIDRTDLSVEQSPYGFYRQTLAYVQTPERVADRLQQATTQYAGPGPDQHTPGPAD